MTQVLRGNIIQAPRLGELDIREHGYLVLEDGVVQGVYDALPQALASAPITDYGDRLIMQSFVDMHLHAPQYPMLGMGMDLPLLDWLNTYTFRTEARFADPDFARRTYRRLASDLITNGTTRVCMFSSLHTEATWILMEELERAGVTGYVGKVNMDRNALPGILQETTEESVSETLRWLDGCHFEHVRPIITPRFTPSCSNELMAALGEIARDRGLYVQSHLSENRGEIAWVKELHPDCAQYWETYDKYGLWKDHTVMAHCVHSDARECAAIRRAGVVVAHCAGSNINLCSGVSPVREMLQQGIWVTLGSDIAGGAQLPMYKVITMSIRASKIKRMETDWSEDFLTVPEGYYLGTTAGHRYFGGGEGFAVGQPLHAIVVDDGDFPESVRPLTVREPLPRERRLFCPLLWIRRAEAFDQNGPVKWKYWKNTEVYTEYSWKIFPITSYASPLAANKHKCACTADGISGAEKGRLTFWRICPTRTQSQETVREISTKNNGTFITAM